MEVKVTGTEELKLLLRKAAHSLDKRVVTQMIKESTRPMVNMAQMDAAGINEDRKTYNLTRSGQKYTLKPGVIQRSINVKVLKRSPHATAIVAPIFSRVRSKDPWFAHFVHEGTGRRSHKGMDRGQIVGMGVTKFMNRAGSESSKSMVRGIIERKIIQRLKMQGL